MGGGLVKQIPPSQLHQPRTPKLRSLSTHGADTPGSQWRGQGGRKQAEEGAGAGSAGESAGESC